MAGSILELAPPLGSEQLSSLAPPLFLLPGKISFEERLFVV